MSDWFNSPQASEVKIFENYPQSNVKYVFLLSELPKYNLILPFLLDE